MTNKHEQLKKLVYKGAEDKNLVISDVILDSINYELSIIEERGFTDYFILYARIIEICNELNLLRSFGRNTAPSSIINYCLDITKINPIEKHLIFERFINPKLKKVPDIDTDIPIGYQEKVLEKLKQKYPEYNTYFIALSNSTYNSEYKDVVYNNTIYKKHPCGIIITPNKLTHSTFLYQGQDFYLALDTLNDPIYYNKFDILELEYLNRLQLIVNEIGEKYHPYKLPLNDTAVFDFFTSGNLENIFQFNAFSLKRIFSEFKPDSINDLSIINALFRPGMLDCFPDIIRNKHNSEDRFCPSDARVSEILSETYGCLIYQETLLRLSKEIAGISFAEAEIWRIKMLRDESNKALNTFSSMFTNGCKQHSSLRENEISSLTAMLRLTFQKAHSLSYAIIGYWGCFYKTHFRKEFEIAFNKDMTFPEF